jgi:hypothetical protein
MLLIPIPFLHTHLKRITSSPEHLIPPHSPYASRTHSITAPATSLSPQKSRAPNVQTNPTLHPSPSPSHCQRLPTFYHYIGLHPCPRLIPIRHHITPLTTSWCCQLAIMHTDWQVIIYPPSHRPAVLTLPLPLRCARQALSRGQKVWLARPPQLSSSVSSFFLSYILLLLELELSFCDEQDCDFRSKQG